MFQSLWNAVFGTRKVRTALATVVSAVLVAVGLPIEETTANMLIVLIGTVGTAVIGGTALEDAAAKRSGTFEKPEGK